MKIKAIETKYKGHRFRSRLEARWAVFFDSFKEKWRYEIEGFNLPSGYYLPDFWLPRFDCWLEIKPTEPLWGAPNNPTQQVRMRKQQEERTLQKPHDLSSESVGRIYRILTLLGVWKQETVQVVAGN